MFKEDTRLLDILFVLWVLSLPFYQIGLIGTLSLDNILTLLVLGTWAFTIAGSTKAAHRRNAAGVAVSLIIIHLFLIMVSLTARGTFKDVIVVMLPEIKFKLYFLVPLFCLTTPYQYNRALLLLLIDGVIVAAAAFFQAVGVLNLTFSRSIAGDRLGIEGLFRSPGLFANYGDVAVLLALTTLVLFFLLPTTKSGRSKTLRGVTLLVIILGVLATQSRNVVLSIFIGLFSYWFFHGTLAKGGAIGLKLIALAVVGSSALVLIYFALPQILDLLLGSGGVRASVLDRFEHYKVALSMIMESPLIGLSAEEHLRNLDFINSVHNFWLIFMLKGGVLAVLPIVALIVFTLRWALQHVDRGDQVRRRRGAIVASMLVVLFTSSLVYVVHFSIFFWSLFGVLVAYGGLSYSKGQASTLAENLAVNGPKPRILRRKRLNGLSE